MLRFKPLPPAEAIKFFRGKGYAIGFDWRDVWQAEHQAAFTVAKAMQLSILKTIRAEVARSLTDGIPFRDFAKTLKPRLVQQGWWGRAILTDPKTGQPKDVQLGSTRRLKVIYDTNLRTSHSEGQWARIQAVKDALPFLFYDANNSAQPREQHAAWDGLVLPVDDPFWQEHMPVKAWGCKCRVRQLTEGQVKRKKLRVGTTPKVPAYTYRNKRTGGTQRIPKGVDPEFHYPPGGRRQSLDDHLVAGLADTPPDQAAASIRSMVAAREFKQWMDNPKGNMPVMQLPEEVATAIGAKSRVGMLSAETVGKNRERHPDMSLTDYRQLPDMGEAPTVVIQDGENTVVIVRKGARLYSAAVKTTKTGMASFVTSFRKTNDKDVRTFLRRGRVIYGEWE